MNLLILSHVTEQCFMAFANLGCGGGVLGYRCVVKSALLEGVGRHSGQISCSYIQSGGIIASRFGLTIAR